MKFVLGVAAALAVYNNATNLVGVPDEVYVPMNLAAAAGLVAVARRRGYDPATLGFARSSVAPGLWWGLGAAAVVGASLGVAAALPGTDGFFADARVAGLGAGGLAWVTLVRIPLGTSLWEEVAFRGVLYGAWARERSPLAAAVGSSAVFGLWHVAPTLVLLETNEVALDAGARVLAVTGSVAATFVAGLLFCALRARTGGIVAPWIAHTATNSLGTVAAFLAQRGG